MPFIYPIKVFNNYVIHQKLKNVVNYVRLSIQITVKKCVFFRSYFYGKRCQINEFNESICDFLTIVYI